MLIEKKSYVVLACIFLSYTFLSAEQAAPEQNPHVYFGLLAGGSGERLWPLSNPQRPKQLLPFLDDKTLLEETIDRVRPMAADNDHVFVVTRADQVPLITHVAGDKIGFFVEEPCGRNTAPAILYSCQTIFNRDPQAVIVFLPVDHFIPDGEGFRDTLQAVVDQAQKSTNMCILGIKPTFAATGYGYIQANQENQLRDASFFPVKCFCEKPDRTTAEHFVQQGDMLWNVGIVAASVVTFINELARYQPELFAKMKDFVCGNASYDQLPSVCISRGVLEKSSNAIVFPADFEWHDVGNIDVFLTLQNRHGKAKSRVVNVDGDNNLAFSPTKKVVCVGVHDVRVIETDDVLLIVHKDLAEKVRPSICGA